MPQSQFSVGYSRAIGKLIELRRKAGFTQATVASKMGMRQSDVSKIERRERRIDIYELHLYASAIGLDAVELDRALADEFRPD